MKHYLKHCRSTSYSIASTKFPEGQRKAAFDRLFTRFQTATNTRYTYSSQPS